MANEEKPQTAHANENPNEEVPINVEPFKFAGYLATVAAAFSCTLGLMCFKVLPVEDNLQEKAKACMIRGAMMMLLCGLTIHYEGLSFRVARGEYLVNFFRSSLGAIDMLLTYASLKYISMGECTAIIYLSPIWTCLLGAIVLGEPLKISLLLGLPVSLLGMVLLSTPDLLFKVGPLEADAEPIDAGYFQARWPGIAIALIVGLLMALVTILLRVARKTPIVACTFYLGLAMVLLGAVVQAFIGFGSMPTSGLEWALHLCIGLFSYCTQFLFQWALKFVPAGTYSVIRTLDIAIGFTLGAFFLNDLVVWTSVAGSALIMIVVVLLILDEHLVRSAKSVFRTGHIDSERKWCEREEKSIS